MCGSFFEFFYLHNRLVVPELTNGLHYRQESSSLNFRGRKLVLNYTDGSPCPPPSDTTSHKSKLLLDGNDARDNNSSDGDGKENVRRKSTLISFLCDHELLAAAPTVAYVGTMDSCSYYFEIRSASACGGVAADADGGVGPGGVFAIM